MSRSPHRWSNRKGRAYFALYVASVVLCVTFGGWPWTKGSSRPAAESSAAEAPASPQRHQIADAKDRGAHRRSWL